jgi:hypothetical protein
MSLDQELRTVLGERAEAGQAPIPDIDALKAGGLVRRRRRRLAVVALPGLVVLAILAAGLVGGQDRPFSGGHDPGPAEQSAVPFVGRWTSTDADGSSQTMTIRATSDGHFEMVLRDDLTAPCSGPSTDTGTGTLEWGRLLVTGIETVCEDGRNPVSAGSSLTFRHRAGSDTLSDDVGVVWSRA